MLPVEVVTHISRHLGNHGDRASLAMACRAYSDASRHGAWWSAPESADDEVHQVVIGSPEELDEHLGWLRGLTAPVTLTKVDACWEMFDARKMPAFMTQLAGVFTGATSLAFTFSPLSYGRLYVFPPQPLPGDAYEFARPSYEWLPAFSRLVSLELMQGRWHEEDGFGWHVEADLRALTSLRSLHVRPIDQHPVDPAPDLYVSLSALRLPPSITSLHLDSCELDCDRPLAAEREPGVCRGRVPRA